MIRTQIYLPQNQISQLKQIAYKEEVSVSEIIRRTLEEKLTMKRKKGKDIKKKKYKNVGAWLLSQARMAERQGWKGPRDLASNVDKYLYGRKD
ncbi:CopG family transcriptional regulator [Candidatus Roizmanbacteria bacterium]|nr:CopG family transcriptional regulator [Candidatus Roizmanbacteria bacterium]